MDVHLEIAADALVALCPWEPREAVYCQEALTERTRQVWPTVTQDLYLIAKIGRFLLTEDRIDFARLLSEMGRRMRAMQEACEAAEIDLKVLATSDSIHNWPEVCGEVAASLERARTSGARRRRADAVIAAIHDRAVDLRDRLAEAEPCGTPA